MKAGCIFVLGCAIILGIVGGICGGSDPYWDCWEDAQSTTEAYRLRGAFSNQYQEDTFRRQQEALCRALYRD